MIVEKMKDQRESKPFLDEIPRCFDRQMQKSSVPSMDPCVYTGGSSSFTPFDHKRDRFFADSSVPDCWYRGNKKEVMVDELGLARDFHKMYITDRRDVCSDIRQFGRDPNVFRITERNVAKVNPNNGENFGYFEGLTNDFSGKQRFQPYVYGVNMGFNDGTRSVNVAESQSNALYKCPVNHLLNELSHLGSEYGGTGTSMPQGNGFLSNETLFQRGNGCYGDEILLQKNKLHSANDSLEQHLMDLKGNKVSCSQNFSMRRPCPNDAALQSFGMNFNAKMGVSDSINGSHFVHPKQGLSIENNLNGTNNGKKSCLVANTMQSLLSYNPMFLQPTFNSLAEVQDNIYLMAKDQHGCRALQKKFDEGSFEDLQLIFSEIIDHVVELMMNPFGNYLIQKLLDVCNEEQRMKIVQMVSREPGQLIKISLNTHGTRVIQKLIETLKTRRQISLVVRALEPGFLDLIKDLNGNHVIQRCLQCLSIEDNKFIFDAAAKFCVEIATHRHGCCVLQRCIAHSEGENQQKLVAEISSNGLHLAQDPFGNYVVQYIIEMKDPSASAKLVSQFEGNYVQLSMQKFSSHVVEKCLKFIEQSRPRIVYELLSVSEFEQLLQHPFANYVIQSALVVTKGALHESLVAAVRPHTVLRTNPYCKKIFSRGLLKK